MPLRRRGLASAAAVALALPAFVPPASAEEGMWTFDAFPAARVREQYGWAPDQAWLDRVRAAAVRLTGGCSGSFVSPEGLVLTNHHRTIAVSAAAVQEALAKVYGGEALLRELSPGAGRRHR